MESFIIFLPYLLLPLQNILFVVSKHFSLIGQNAILKFESRFRVVKIVRLEGQHLRQNVGPNLLEMAQTGLLNGLNWSHKWPNLDS